MKLGKRDVGASMADIETCYVISTPMCNGCVLWKRGTHSCEKYPNGIPKAIRYKKYHNCSDFELNQGSINMDAVRKNIEEHQRELGL